MSVYLRMAGEDFAAPSSVESLHQPPSSNIGKPGTLSGFQQRDPSNVPEINFGNIKLSIIKDVLAATSE
jgi:hypothetical protein